MPNGINIVEILCVRLEYHVNGSRLSREVSVMAIEKRSPERQVVDGRTIEIPCPTMYLRWFNVAVFSKEGGGEKTKWIYLLINLNTIKAYRLEIGQ